MSNEIRRRLFLMDSKINGVIAETANRIAYLYAESNPDIKLRLAEMEELIKQSVKHTIEDIYRDRGIT